MHALAMMCVKKRTDSFGDWVLFTVWSTSGCQAWQSSPTRFSYQPLGLHFFIYIFNLKWMGFLQHNPIVSWGTFVHVSGWLRKSPFFHSCLLLQQPQRSPRLAACLHVPAAFQLGNLCNSRALGDEMNKGQLQNHPTVIPEMGPVVLWDATFSS